MRSRLHCWTEGHFTISVSRYLECAPPCLWEAGKVFLSLSQQQSWPLNMPAVAKQHFPTPPSLSISDSFEARIYCVTPPSISSLSTVITCPWKSPTNASNPPLMPLIRQYPLEITESVAAIERCGRALTVTPLSAWYASNVTNIFNLLIPCSPVRPKAPLWPLYTTWAREHPNCY